MLLCVLQRPVLDNTSAFTLQRRAQLGVIVLWPALLVYNELFLLQRSPLCTVIHVVYIYPAMTAFTDQYSLPNIFFDIGQL